MMQEDSNFPNGDAYDKIVKAQRKYEASPKGKQAKKKYFSSDKGRKALRRYFSSAKGAEAQLRYALSEKGKRVRNRIVTQQQVFHMCTEWLALNPGKTAADFFELVLKPNGQQSQDKEIR